MSLIESIMPRRRPRAEAPPEATLLHWSQSPGVIAAAEARRQAVARVEERAGELRELQEKIQRLDQQVGETGVGRADLADAQAQIALVMDELRWARRREDRSHDDLGAAREAAQSDLAALAVRLLGAAQVRIRDRAIDLLTANMELSDLINEAQLAGLTVGRLIEQTWPVISVDMIEKWEKNARWLPNAGPAQPDTKTRAEVIVRRTGPRPTAGVMVGERCWIAKTDIPGLLKQNAIEVIGTPEGVFIPSSPPQPDASGDVLVRFTDYYFKPLAGGAGRAWLAGETDRVNHKIAWEAVCDQAAVYVTPPEGAC